jgi:UDP-N-acetylglucosamine--N-acetylmuramyl-(pentapeptide) pyrophosphoryl-undecaprenol N-acetylglucosamine transferase
MILVASGATGGHLYPAIAIIDGCTHPAFFVVPRNMPATRILTAHGMPFSVISFSIRRPIPCLMALVKMVRLIVKKRPRVVLAMGGGICVPFSVIAWVMRIPIISFEQNAIPGRSTRLIQFFSSTIVTAFEGASESLYRKSIVRCLGNPIRLRYPNEDMLPKEWSQMKGKLLAIIGGSQGAMALNQFVYQHRHRIMHNGYHVLHITGPNLDSEAPSFGGEILDDKVYLPIEYLTNMTPLYEKASMVLCRAGATTLAELDMVGTPSVLVPYPYAMDNHQVANAQAFCKSHNSHMILEPDLCIDRVLASFDALEKSHIAFNARSTDNVNASICALVKTYLE